MHHLSVKNNYTDTTNEETRNVGPKGNTNVPICPKPRRPGSALPAQFLNNHSLLCCKHSQMNCDGRSGIISMIPDKGMDGGESSSRCSIGCSSATCDWSGSPPGRTDNPLVHDVHFLRVHQYHMDVLPSFTHQHNFSH